MSPHRRLGPIDRLQCVLRLETSKEHAWIQRIRILSEKLSQFTDTAEHRRCQDATRGIHSRCRTFATGRLAKDLSEQVGHYSIPDSRFPRPKLTDNRARSGGRNRQFFTIPEEYDINSANDTAVNSVVAWSFYPKLLAREGKGWRNVSNNQSVTLHPTSVNKQADASVKWVSFYHLMQARNRNYNAHETSAVDDFAIALLCGDAEFKVCNPSFLLYAHGRSCEILTGYARCTLG